MIAEVLGKRLGTLFRIVLAAILIILGIVITPLPIPFGLILIAIGLIILAYDNDRIVRHIRILRRRFPSFSKKLESLESGQIPVFCEVLRNTNPTNPVQEKQPPST